MALKISGKSLKRKEFMPVTVYPKNTQETVEGKLCVIGTLFYVHRGGGIGNSYILKNGDKIEIPSTDGRDIKTKYEFRL